MPKYNPYTVQSAMLLECLTAVLRGSLRLDSPDIETDEDAVTRVDYYAVNLDRAHGGIVLAVRRVKQPDGQPETVSCLVKYLDEIRARYRSGALTNPNGRLAYERLMHVTQQEL